MKRFGLCWHVLSCSGLTSPPDSIAAILHMQCALWNDLHLRNHKCSEHRSRDMCRADQRRRRIERYADRDPCERRAQAALVEEGANEAAALQKGQDLRCDAATEVYAAHREQLECEVG